MRISELIKQLMLSESGVSARGTKARVETRGVREVPLQFPGKGAY
jgi:hypothetical protein